MNHPMSGKRIAGLKKQYRLKKNGVDDWLEYKVIRELICEVERLSESQRRHKLILLEFVCKLKSELEVIND